MSGKRAAVFDLTGASPHHPYRAKTTQPARVGRPDMVPRVCMSDGAMAVAWSPRTEERRAEGAAPRYALLHSRPVSSILPAPLLLLDWRAPLPSEVDGSRLSPLRSEMATVNGTDGVVKLWNPHGLPMRKGGNGDPANPQRMKPQFYIWPTHDATHPSGEAARPCALMWLRDDTIAVGYYNGDVVAWRIAGSDDAVAIV